MQGKRRRTTKISKACVPAHHLLFNCFLKNSVDNSVTKGLLKNHVRGILYQKTQ
jgi:hypothetical protein